MTTEELKDDQLPKLEEFFPGLRESGYRVTSPPSVFYNCVSWAAGDTKRPWWPDRDLFWPSEFYEETVEAFAATFALFGRRRPGGACAPASCLIP